MPAPSSDQPAASKKASPLPELTMMPPSNFAVIPTTTQTLLCGFGETEAGPVLVPYLELRLLKTNAEESMSAEDLQITDTFEATLSFENVAYLLMDISRDFHQSSERLAMFSSGEVKPEPMRLSYAKRSLERAMTELEKSLAIIEGLTGDEVETVATPAASQSRPLVRRKTVRAKST